MREFVRRCKIAYSKVAEFQARGLIHLHVPIRLDGPEGPDGPAPDLPTAGDHGGRGVVMRNHNFRSPAFAPAAERIGMPGLTPHDLRHTAASLAVQVGANVKAVQRMLGHASAAMTLDVYSGLFDDDLDALAERMDAAHDAHKTSRSVGTVWAQDPVVKIDDQATGL